jgi:hypothetical protein
MRQLAFVVVAALELAACSASQLMAQRDDQTCRAKGLEVGSVGYTDCRAALDKERDDRTAHAVEDQPKFQRLPGQWGAPL